MFTISKKDISYKKPIFSLVASDKGFDANLVGEVNTIYLYVLEMRKMEKGDKLQNAYFLGEVAQVMSYASHCRWTRVAFRICNPTIAIVDIRDSPYPSYSWPPLDLSVNHRSARFTTIVIVAVLRPHCRQHCERKHGSQMPQLSPNKHSPTDIQEMRQEIPMYRNLGFRPFNACHFLRDSTKTCLIASSIVSHYSSCIGVYTAPWELLFCNLLSLLHI